MKFLIRIKEFFYPEYKKEEDVIKLNRLYCFYTLLLIPLFVLGVFGIDPARVILDITSYSYLLTIFILSFFNEFIKKHFGFFLLIGFLFVTFNTLFINYQESFDLKSFLTLVTVISAVGLVVQNHYYTLFYSLITLGMTYVTLYLVNRDSVLYESYLFYLSIIFLISLVSFYMTRFKSLASKQVTYNASLLGRIFQDSPDALFLLNKQSNVIEDVNQSALTMFGLSKKENLLGSDYLDFSKKYKEGRKFFQEEFINEEEWHKEIKYKTAHDKVLWVDQVVSNIVSEDRNFYLIRMTDITVRKSSEEHLEKLSLAVEQNPSIVVIYDAKGKIEYINDIFEKITGISKNELIGTDFSMFGDDAIIEYVKENGSWEGEIKYHKKDGSILIERAKISTILNKKQQITHFVKVAEDITDKRYTEETLKIVLDNINEIVYSVKIDAEEKKTLDYVSPKVKDIFGFEVEEYKNNQQEVLKSYHPEDLIVLQKSNEAMKKKPKPSRFVYRFKHKVTNQYIWAEESLFPQVNEEGKMFAIFGVVRDITERVESQEKMRLSEERYRLLYSKANDAILIIDNGTIIDCNEKALSMFKASRQDMMGSTPFVFYPEKQPDGEDSILKGYDYMQAALDGIPQNYYWKHWTLNGPQFDSEVGITMFEVEGKKLLQFIIRDITLRKKAEESKNQMIDSYFELFNQSTSFIIILDKYFNIKDINNSVVNYYQEEKEKLIGKSYSNILISDPKNSVALPEKLKSSWEGNNEKLDCLAKGNNEDEFPLELLLNKGSFFGEEVLIARARDIRARVQYEKTLQESEEKFRTLSWSAPIGIFQEDKNGETVYINQAIIQLFSVFDPLEFHEKWEKMVHPDDYPRVRLNIENSMKNKINTSYEYRVVRDGKDGKDGKEDIWVNAQVRLIINDQGDILGRIGTIEDITARKLYESAIKESEERFKLLSDVTLESILLCENDKIVDINDRFLEMYGYISREEVIGMNIFDFVVPEQHAIVRKRTNSVINETSEFTHIRKDGSKFIVESRSEVIKLNDRNVMVYAVNDITARKIAQEELVKSEQNYRKLVEILPDGLVIHDNGKIIFVNPEALNLFDCQRKSDLIGQQLLDYIHPEDRDKTQKRIDQVQKGRDKADYTESRILSKLGVVKTVEGCQVPYNLDGKPVVKLVVRNISDRKRVEKEKLRAELAEETSRQLQIEINERKAVERKLRLAQQFTRSIIDSSLDMICASDVNNSITEFNHAAQQTFGYTLEEAFDLDPMKIFATPEDAERVRKAMESEGHFSGEINNVRKSGEVFPVFLSASVLINQQGERVGEMGISRDITELKNTEKFLKASLKEKEVLLKEVHHRVKNNLQVISSILNLQTSYVSDVSTLDILKECQNRIKSMSFIHESLYQSRDLSDVNFSSYIQNLCSNLHYSYSMRGRAIQMNFDIENVFLKLDTAIPCGLIINELVSNSFKYAFVGREEGELLVSLKAIWGNDFELIVQDNGIGLPDNFNVEQTDSLGLQLVITLVDQIRGDLLVDSQNGVKYTIRFKDIYKEQDVEH